MPRAKKDDELKPKKKRKRRAAKAPVQQPIVSVEAQPEPEVIPETEYVEAEPCVEASSRQHVKPVYTSTTVMAKRKFNIVWWRAIAGGILSAIGLLLFSIYFADVKAMWAGAGAVFTLAPGVFLVYWSFNKFSAGFEFSGKRRKYTGKENVLILFAKKNGNGKDLPIGVKPAQLTYVPIGSRLHYVRNWKKHMYYLYNDTNLKRLLPVTLPDKPSFPPELFKHHATMELFKDAIEYRAPSTLQKIAPGILLLAMIIVGILMVMTVPQ